MEKIVITQISQIKYINEEEEDNIAGTNPKIEYVGTINRTFKAKNTIMDGKLKNSNSTRSEQSRENENNSLKSSLKHSIHFNLKWNPLKFFLLKLLSPVFFCSIFLYLLIIIQSYIEDYCFRQYFCACQHFLSYIYTAFKEFLHLDITSISWTYFAFSYLFKQFREKYYLKIIFLALHFLLYFILYGIFFENRKEDMLGTIRIYKTCVSIGIFIFLAVILSFFFKECTKILFKKMTKFCFLTCLYLFHILFIQNTFRLYFLRYLYLKFDHNLALNLFKIFLLLYYSLYEYFFNKILSFVYKDIISEDHDSLNISIFATKLIYSDITTIKLMNVLTITFTQIYSWISLLNYISSMFSAYLNIKFLRIIITKLWRKFFPKKCKKIKSESSINLGSLKSGCILEINIMTFILTFFQMQYKYFFCFTKTNELYIDCTLKEKQMDFLLIPINMIIVFAIQCCLIFGIFAYMIKKKKLLLNIVIENQAFLIRCLFIICYFTQIEISFQFYMLLGIPQN